MADVEQMKKIVPFVTCEITFGQQVCELVLGVKLYLIWILGTKSILSNSQSRATLSVLETCLIVGLLPLMIILITASLSSKIVHQHGLDHQSFHEFSFALEIYTGLPVLDHSDECFREEL